MTLVLRREIQVSVDNGDAVYPSKSKIVWSQTSRIPRRAEHAFEAELSEVEQDEVSEKYRIFLPT